MGKRRLKKTQENNDEIGDQKLRTKCITKKTKSDADIHCRTEGGRKSNVFERKKKCTEPNKDSSNNYENSATEDLFPYWFAWILFPLTLSVRILYVLEPSNWWILHPDEIFQTIEGKHLQDLTLVIFSSRYISFICWFGP